MKKILVLGSSHIGALKGGFDQLDGIKDCQFYFAGLGGSRFYDLRVDGAKITCLRKSLSLFEGFSDVDTPIELGSFDKIVLVGTPSRAYPFLYYSTSTCSFVHSQECFRDIFYSIWTYPVRLSGRSRISEMFRDLALSLPEKIVFAGNPIPRDVPTLDALKSISDESFDQWSQVYLWMKEESIASIANESVPSIYLPDRLMLDISGRFPLLKKEYFEGLMGIQGKKTLSGQKKSIDWVHANELYGRDLLNDLVKHCL